MGSRDRGWEPLADAITTSDRINLLCELPPAPSPREPESCVGSGEGLRCLWRTDDQTFGHGTLAVWIGAPLSKKVRLRCIFPVDGGPRRVEACAAVIGD